MFEENVFSTNYRPNFAVIERTFNNHNVSLVSRSRLKWNRRSLVPSSRRSIFRRKRTPPVVRSDAVVCGARRGLYGHWKRRREFSHDRRRVRDEQRNGRPSILGRNCGKIVGRRAPRSTTDGQRTCIIDRGHFKDISDREIPTREKSRYWKVCAGRVLKMLTTNVNVSTLRENFQSRIMLAKGKICRTLLLQATRRGFIASRPKQTDSPPAFLFTKETRVRANTVSKKNHHNGFSGPERCFAYWFHANRHR